LIDKTICVIDDNAAVRRSLENLLRSMGYRAHTFESAEDFLAHRVDAAFDCAICDIRMGPMSGPQLLAHLRSAGHVMPFIFVTAYAHERHMNQASGNGAICVLEKPIDADKLECWIEYAIRSRNPPDAQAPAGI
jgi:FixJ family two-component response regulator